MIPHFLERFRRDSSNVPILRLLEKVEDVIAVYVKQKLPHGCEREVTLRKLDELKIPELNRFPEVRELVLISSLSFNFPRQP